MEQSPRSFTLNGRTHRVGSWQELVHELLEDLFVLSDPEGNLIAGSVISDTDKQIVFHGGYQGRSVKLSNGLRLPSDYSEREYALACRTVCIAYSVTPCEMSIEFEEASEERGTGQEPPVPSEITENEIPEPAEPDKQTSSVNTEGPASEISITEIAAKNDSDMYIEPVRNGMLDSISGAEEIWMKLMAEKEEQKPADKILLKKFNDNGEETDEVPDWNMIMERLQNDNQALTAARMIKKVGIKPPDTINFRGIKQFNKVGGEALFVWMDESVAYLHGRQKYGRGYFLSRNFKHVIVDDPRELIRIFRDMEADNE